MSEDPGRQAFYDEARELLAEIEESLLELENAPDNSEQVARLFRAMHTIKGSGSMFGFDEIARFTHEVETVFDRVRAGSLPLTTELLGITLEAKDHIQNLLGAADTGPLAPLSDALMAKFRSFGGPPPAPETLKDNGPHVVEPPAANGATHTYWVRYRPAPETFSTGANPLGLMEELAGFGRIRVRFHDDHIPPLETIDPERAYGWWDALLNTNRGEDAVRDVFIFVDEADVSIHKVAEVGLRGADIAELFALIDAHQGQPSQLAAAALANTITHKTALRGTGVSAQPSVTKTEIQEKAAATTQSGSIRVDAVRLDSLVNLVGELVIVQSRLTQAVHSKNHNALRGIAEELERLASEMRDHALGIRMVPIGGMYATLRRLVRDLSASLGKKIDFVGHGAETELDKNVIDRLKDPLVHILRNSVDHGVESPEARREAGKPEKGVIELRAGHESGNVVLTIRDDGAGINSERVRQKAVERGLIPPEAELTPEQTYDLIFQPGFSTAQQVSNVSGRGVGMDVVRKNIEALRGAITMDSAAGQGTTISVRLPLTLAIIDGLQFRIGKEFFIIPLPMVQACQERQVSWPQKQVDVIEVRGDLIPCLSLRRMLDIPGTPPPFERIIIAGVNGSLVGLAVDAVVGQQQTVIKSLSSLYQDVRWVSGTTINGDGGISLILDVPQLVRFAQDQFDSVKNHRQCDSGGSVG